MDEFFWFAGIVIVCVAGTWLIVHCWEGGPDDRQNAASDGGREDKRDGLSEFERAFREQERAARAQEGYDGPSMRH